MCILKHKDGKGICYQCKKSLVCRIKRSPRYLAFQYIFSMLFKEVIVFSLGKENTVTVLYGYINYNEYITKDVTIVSELLS